MTVTARRIAIGAVVAALIVGGLVLSGCSTQVGAGTTAVKVDDYLVIPTDPKVEGCIEVVEAGVEGVVIIDGRVPHCVLLELFTEHGVGTLIERKAKKKA